MNLTDKENNKLKGIFIIKTVDAKTGEILDEYKEHNAIVLDSREAVTIAISQPVANSTINNIKMGEDFGESMIGSPTVTFANANPDTITRSTGSWITDGFLVGDKITASGSVSNDGEYTIATGGVTATVLTLTNTDVLVNEGPVASVAISTGTVDAPITAQTTYDETDMSIIFDAPYTLAVGFPNAQSVNFSVTIIGSDVMALYPSDTSKRFNSAALHTGNGNVFAYKRFPQKSISALVNLSVVWGITY